jgi:hypothetical protein
VFASEREKVLASGMDDFLRKPYRREEVFDCLGRHLSIRYRLAGQPGSPQPELDRNTAAESMAAIPDDLRQELRDAIVSLDSRRIATVIAKVAEFDDALAAVLRSMYDRLAYTAMLKTIESAAGLYPNPPVTQ